MRRLQEFGFEKSAYERPNQKWVCGHAKEGRCCFSGPDAHGHCTATAECRPLRKGDRWFCARPAFLGGPCAEGPLPDGQCCRPIPKCSPVRSLRYSRGITVLVTVAATLAALLLCLGLKHGNRLFSPGELTFAHSSAGNNCAQCHGAMGGAAAGWLAGTTNSAHDNSRLCLNCHNVGEAPLQPHSLPPDRLAPLTAAVKKHSTAAPPAGLALASFIPSLDHPGDTGIACATCHKEHRGKEASIQKLSDNQCQNCHASQFVSFADGHPQFSHYPFYRRTRIIFDHESHLHGHFADPAVAKSAPVSCLDCHETDPRGGAMLVKSFEAVCASCHDQKIKGGSGIPFISLPQIDDQTLSGDFSVGDWPRDVNAQPLTPFLRFLLAGDPTVRDALDKLRGVDLSTLPKADPAKIKAAQTLAWGIKSLIYDLGAGGQNELIRRVNLSLGRPLSTYEQEGIVAFLPADILQTAFSNAFPRLQREILDHRNNAKPPPTQLIPSPDLAKPGPVKAVAPDVLVSQGGWYSPDGSFTLFYRPRGHADRFLSSWMNMTVNPDATGDPDRCPGLDQVSLNPPHRRPLATSVTASTTLRSNKSTGLPAPIPSNTASTAFRTPPTSAYLT